MRDEANVRNHLGGGSSGPVVQAGTIQHISLGSAADAGTGRADGPPRQLPLAVRDFTGRAEYLAALDALIADDDASGGVPGAVLIWALDGAAGIGKTTLAVHWAHRVQHRFRDGTLHINLRGYGPGTTATAGEALDGFLRALGVPVERIPADLEARAALYRSVLNDRQVLIVLDNANSADQVRPLLPGSPGCMVVVTSRDSLTGLVVTESARRLTLDLLTEHEAQALVAGIIGPDRAATESGAVIDLTRLCARLPLALRIAAGRAAIHPHSSVAGVVAELTDDRNRLDVLSRGAATIAATTTHSGLRVHAELDTGSYPTGIQIGDADMAALPITQHAFRGDWNYVLHPTLANAIPSGDTKTSPTRWSQRMLSDPTLTAALANLHDAQPGTGLGRPPTLSFPHQVLAAVLHFRLALPAEPLAVLFGSSRAAVHRTFHKIKRLLDQHGTTIPHATSPPAALAALHARALALGDHPTNKINSAR